MQTIVLLDKDGIGHGPEELRKKMMGSFLRMLWSNGKKPDVIIFYDTGIKLLSEGSSVLDALDGLSNAGVDLLACGTCVKYYKLEDKLKLGRIGNMQDIVRLMMDSEKVITP
jgi:selenium metabolism protein YedF